MTFSGRVALGDDKVTLDDIAARVADTNLRGALGISLGLPHRLQGTLEADRVDGASLIAAAIGLPDSPAPKAAAWSWSEAPFGAGAFGDYTGDVAVKVRRVSLLPRLSARQFSATLHASKNAFALDGMTGVMDGGTFNGSLAFKSGDDGVSLKTKLTLADAESANLLPAEARPPVTGALGLSVELESSGLSPVALVGGLHGSGKLTMKDAAFAGLNPHAFGAVTDVVDAGLQVKGDEIANVVRKALESGQLHIERAEGKLAINAGLVRLSDFTASSADAKLDVSSTLDLTDGSLDARLVLSGSDASGRPNIFLALKGPVTAPARSIDVSALTGWLTLRSVENQVKRLKALQQAAPPPAPAMKQQTAPPKNEPTIKGDARDAPASSDNVTADSPTSALNVEAMPRPSAPAIKKREPSHKKPIAPPVAKHPPAPVTVRRATPQRAPALPAPIDIHPLPAPESIVAPEASVGPQR